MNPVPFEIALNTAALQSYGLPDERMARVAARRAFVDMKQAFLCATADIDAPVGRVLHGKVRSATEATELWRLRAAVLAALPARHERTEAHRAELRRQLDSLFPQRATDDTGVLPL